MGFFHNYAVANADEMNDFANGLRESLAFKDSDIALMCDAHLGKSCAVGTVATYSNKIIPNIVGVDLGCRVSAFKILRGDMDLERLDAIVNKYVPAGFSIRDNECEYSKAFPYRSLRCWSAIKEKESRFRLSMGTMGGGNHMVEVDRGDDYDVLLIHCGSRNIGLTIASYYQQKAIEARDSRIRMRKFSTRQHLSLFRNSLDRKLISKLFEEERADIAKEPANDMCYLEGEDMEDYLHDADMMRRWSYLNHKTIAEEIASHMGWDVEEYVTSIHNYVDVEDHVIRKGAISAHAGELGIIPLSMADGCVIVRGKGNADWIQSLPHGAGRLYSRKKAKERLSMEEFKKSMEGIYTSCVCESTLDESQAAYKPAEDIIKAIEENAEMVEHLRPIYNFKAK